MTVTNAEITITAVSSPRKTGSSVQPAEDTATAESRVGELARAG
ncbi:hypothetical protein [Actinoplanes sp. NPDC051494]